MARQLLAHLHHIFFVNKYEHANTIAAKVSLLSGSARIDMFSPIWLMNESRCNVFVDIRISSLNLLHITGHIYVVPWIVEIHQMSQAIL